MTVVSRKQENLLRVIATWRGIGAPVLSTLADELGLASESGVRRLLDPLEEQGLVERFSIAPGRGVPKVPQVTEAGRAYLGLPPVGVPMFGPVHAGECGTSYDEPVRYVKELGDVFPLTGEDYFLPVTGNCMNGGRRPIRQGDLVLMRRRDRLARPHNGRIAHVEVSLGDTGDCEPLIRRYFWHEATGVVRLLHYWPSEGCEEYDDATVEPRGELVRLICGDDDGDAK